jgi:hypothetical protein
MPLTDKRGPARVHAALTYIDAGQVNHRLLKLTVFVYAAIGPTRRMSAHVPLIVRHHVLVGPFCGHIAHNAVVIGEHLNLPSSCSNPFANRGWPPKALFISDFVI